ncbi:MAG: acetylglucosaminyldiphospho-UDP acetyl-beta-D-mannosaminyltransferase [Candidatus Andersenbacteria bacterium CG10_big_fil_rev_8_21_14_0_10_54_11]|uniref:Acetylglucosaminyldiphospho-UDP acetyl-beta-D-mannosaminyltransferase n=1 Tax=Candidatus Andersenbacteria bacterium CG10_big_fil_rev_8_21_14_0_10_54_11 TaxID=1974485 RepID=A0A2M6WZ19_9BACT|nr:MAG: acetylglucosaminyldiphospho-UDP acetyl-beta-D-mannosaminyltransferase [Candidatus Andersenbacteria bacterium CG10_big_fil_rev_8_21_14_0_10_54_11]
MADRIAIGPVDCTFMQMTDFAAWCRQQCGRGGVHHVVTLNPEMVLLAERDAAFREAVRRAELAVPDGAGIVWARWYLRSPVWALFPSLIAFLLQPVTRVQGVDAVFGLADLCRSAGRPLYLLGGHTAAAAAAADRIAQLFPGVKIHCSRAHEYTEDGPPDIVADIRRTLPAVILVAYGAPQQTVWIERQRASLPAGSIAVGVGGAFDILSERLPRAPKLLRLLNLEWLWRLYLEPRRLPRIWRAVVQFPLLMRGYKRRNR